MGVDNLVEVNVAVVAVDNLSLWLECAYDFADSAQFLGFHVGSLVEQHNIAKFNLLDDKILDVVLFKILFQQVVSTAKLILES